MMTRLVLDALREVLTCTHASAWMGAESSTARRVGPAALADVSASVLFRHERCEHGLLVLAADATSAAALVGTVSGLNVPPGSPLVADGLAEITNILAGAARLRVGLPRAQYRPGHCIAELDGHELEHGAVTWTHGAHLDVYVLEQESRAEHP